MTDHFVYTALSDLPSFAACKCGKHGVIRLADGTDSPPVISKKGAEELLHELVSEGKVSVEDKLYVGDTIAMSDMPETNRSAIREAKEFAEGKLEEIFSELLGNKFNVKAVIVPVGCGQPNCPRCKGKVDLSKEDIDGESSDDCQSFGA